MLKLACIGGASLLKGGVGGGGGGATPREPIVQEADDASGRPAFNC